MTKPTKNITPEKRKRTPKLSDKIHTRTRTTPTRSIIKPKRWTYDQPGQPTTKTPTPLKRNNNVSTPVKKGVVLPTQTKTTESKQRSPVPVTKKPPTPSKTKVRVMPASSIKFFLQTDQPIATHPSHNIGTQLNLLIDSIEPMSENEIIKRYFEGVRQNNTLRN